MNIQNFFDKYNNKGIDWDGYYGFQCMDLYHQYNFDVVGGNDIPAPAAKDVWDKYPKDYYERITNTPTGVPQKGDIVIWGVGIGPYGHIAVFDHGDSNSFTSFDQNWPLNSLCHYQNHNYNGVLGWLRPKAGTIGSQQPNSTPLPPQISEQTKIPQIDNQEVGAIRSMLMDLNRDIDSYKRINTEQGMRLEILGKDLKTCQDQPPMVPESAEKLTTWQLVGLILKKLGVK